MFEMYKYTMGKQGYTDEIWDLLDPDGLYFPSPVIHAVNGSVNIVIVLDDTKKVYSSRYFVLLFYLGMEK
jgi:hypothetical protein